MNGKKHEIELGVSLHGGEERARKKEDSWSVYVIGQPRHVAKREV